jgi:hypothetical protein
VKKAYLFILVVFVPVGLAYYGFVGAMAGEGSKIPNIGLTIVGLGLVYAAANFVGSRFNWDVNERLVDRLLITAAGVGFLVGGGSLLGFRYYPKPLLVTIGKVAMLIALVGLPAIALFMRGATRELTEEEPMVVRIRRRGGGS